MKALVTIIIAGLSFCLLIVLVAIGIFFFYVEAVGYKSKKLKTNFNANETEFADLTMFLEKKYVIYPEYTMWLILEKNEKVSITLSYIKFGTVPFCRYKRAKK